MCVPGLIRTALPGMDREVKENYQVVIQAKDMAGQMGGLSGTTTVSITLSDVNDNPPRFTKSEYQLAAAPWRLQTALRALAQLVNICVQIRKLFYVPL